MEIRGIEYTVSTSDGQTTVTWPNGSISSGLEESAVVELAVSINEKKLRDRLLLESDIERVKYLEQTELIKFGLRVSGSQDISEDGYKKLLDYRQKLRDAPDTYVRGIGFNIPAFPGIYLQGER